MKALLLKSDNELKIVFEQLSLQIIEMYPELLQKKEMKFVYQRELFYEVTPSTIDDNRLDVVFIFKEDESDSREIPISLPRDFFIRYEKLDKYNLSIFNKADLLTINEFAINEENYELCNDIKYVLEKSKQK